MNPLVSCIMPTFNRRAFIRAAIDCFVRQTYPNRELVILDDGTDRVGDLVPQDWRIRYVAMAERTTTGEKRNICCELAHGEIICQFDDDDWSAPDRIERQLRTLEETGLPVTGYSNMLYWDLVTGEAKLYQSAVKGYVCGMSLCYQKDWWQKHQFTNKMKASDNDIVRPNRKDIAASDDLGIIVARGHEKNVGGDKRGIGPVVDRSMIPAAFWENERLRVGSATGGTR